MTGVFESLGKWLARFVLELNHYLPAPVDYVEVQTCRGGWVGQSRAFRVSSPAALEPAIPVLSVAGGSVMEL